MRILTEFMGGIILLSIFVYGLHQIVDFITSMEKKHDHVRAENGNAPDAGTTSDHAD